MPEVCTGFEIFPGGSPSDWISGECGPLAMQNADGAWVLPEAAGDWFPAVENPFQQYLEVIASTAASGGESAADSLSEDMIWEYVHEKLEYAHWAQDMTAEYEDIVRKFQIEDSKMSDLPGDVSQWPRYYSAFVDYFSCCKRRSAVSGRRYHLDEGFIGRPAIIDRHADAGGRHIDALLFAPDLADHGGQHAPERGFAERD